LKSVVEFVLDMRERLRSSITHAQQRAEEQKNKLLADYAVIFSDTPGKTLLATHHPPHLNGPKRQFLNRMYPHNQKIHRDNFNNDGIWNYNNIIFRLSIVQVGIIYCLIFLADHQCN